MKLTESEKLYLAELKRMERAKESFSHAAMCKTFGWKSTARSFQVMTALISKGLVEHGTRLAKVECPVVRRAA